MISGISAVAFDLDGTLYPNYSLYVRLLPFLFKHTRLLAAMGKARSVIRREQTQSLSSCDADFYERQARAAANILHKRPEQVKKQFEKLIYRGWEPHFSKIQLFPYMRELLGELRAAGLKLGLLSDFPPRIKLEKLGLAGCWDTVLCSEETGEIKPALRPFTELAKALNCQPEQILYVGNSRRYDVAGAGRTGMKTALLTSRLLTGKYIRGVLGRKTACADFTFHDYRQLRDFVLK